MKAKGLIALFNDKANIALDVTENLLNNAREYGIIDENLFIEKSDETKVLSLCLEVKKITLWKNRKAIEIAVQRTADSFFPNKMFTPRLSKISIDYSTSKAKESISNIGLKIKKLILWCSTQTIVWSRLKK